MLREGNKGCHRGDRCWFHHSSAHMTPCSKMLVSHVEKNVLLLGCPRPQDELWILRQNYPAPWPLIGVSHLTKDGETYAPKPQQWAVGPFKLSHIDGYAIHDGPQQLTEPLASSRRARRQAGQRPQTPQGPGTDAPVFTNTRQGPKPRAASVNRSRSVTVQGGHTYDNHRQRAGADNTTKSDRPYSSGWGAGTWDEEEAEDMPQELPPKYISPARRKPPKKLHLK